MRRLAVFLMVFLAAALPLRGMAAFAADPCAGHHGIAAGAVDPGAGHGCDHASDDVGATPNAAQGHESGNTAESCAHCVACACAGVSLVVGISGFDAGPLPGVERIPFLPPYAAGHFPTFPDRPPLAS